MSNSNAEVFEVVKKHFLDICPDAPADRVTPEVSMKDLGASSLDMVEVVTSSMRELGVRIPREALSEIKNIGGLVDVLLAAIAKKAA